MRTLILIFLIVIAVVCVTGASASDGPSGAAGVTPPTMPSDVTCTSDPAAIQQELGQAGIPTAPGQYAKVCFYPEHMR